MKVLYEILVPTIYGDTLTPIKTKHHKQWDKFVQNITGGLTILKPAIGKWTHKGKEYPTERVIPVRIMCFEPIMEPIIIRMGYYEPVYNKNQINKIIQFTLSHYRQKAVFYYQISDNVNVVYAKE